MANVINVAKIPTVVGTKYPAPFDKHCLARKRQRLGDAVELTQFGVNLLTLPPGSWSSQRHWHTESDEFLYVIAGEVVLVTNDKDIFLRAGDVVGFKAGDPNGHCLQNRSNGDVSVLEVGTRVGKDVAYYTDIDMVAPALGLPAMYTHRDGTPY